MAHIRKQVRDAVRDRLMNLPTTGARVYVNNVDPLAVHELPSLTIRAGSESVEVQSIGQPNAYTRRTMTVIVTANVRATSAVDDTLDSILEEVEPALLYDQADKQLDGLAVDVTLVAVDEPRISGDGDRLVGTVDMQFQVLVNAREGIPGAAI